MQLSSVQHGEFTLSVSGNILLANLSGAWNEEAAHAFSKDLKSKVTPLVGADWGHLVYLDDWSLGVPEIKPIVEELVAWCCGNGLKRAAHVYSSSMLKKLQLEDFVAETGDFQRRAFASEAEAIAWLAAEGYGLAHR